MTVSCDGLIYYYHSDHIGSTSFITDRNGGVYEFLLYLPFGETMAHQKDGGYSTPYKFIAKELNEEPGLYYFGARYYDPTLSIWHGVDPLADMFPSQSPYLYA